MTQPAPHERASRLGPLAAPERLTDLAYKRLREALSSGTLTPGGLIGEAELSAALGISRTSLREALVRLETVGFVSRHASRWRVYAMNAQDAQDVYQCRIALEGLAVRLAATLAASGQLELAPLTEALAAARRELAKDDFAAVARYTGEFHDRLVQAPGNGKLILLMDALQPQVRFNRFMMMRHGVRGDFLSENEALLAAVAAGDTTRSVALVEQMAAEDLRAVGELLQRGVI